VLWWVRSTAPQSTQRNAVVSTHRRRSPAPAAPPPPPCPPRRPWCQHRRPPPSPPTAINITVRNGREVTRRGSPLRQTDAGQRGARRLDASMPPLGAPDGGPLPPPPPPRAAAAWASPRTAPSPAYACPPRASAALGAGLLPRTLPLRHGQSISIGSKTHTQNKTKKRAPAAQSTLEGGTSERRRRDAPVDQAQTDTPDTTVATSSVPEVPMPARRGRRG
jgi:hypothetical protein